MPTRILFVCMGNICRSPAAEGVFLHLARERGVADQFEVDSAGTGGWHQGEGADPRSIEEGKRRGYRLVSAARQVVPMDFESYDLLVCMDNVNQRDLAGIGSGTAETRRLLDWHPQRQGEDVPDPYYGGDQGFSHMYDLIEVACAELLDDLAS